MDRTGSFYLPDASSILAIDIYIPVAQWKRALGYEPRFVARSNRVRDAIGDYLSWLADACLDRLHETAYPPAPNARRSVHRSACIQPLVDSHALVSAA